MEMATLLTKQSTNVKLGSTMRFFLMHVVLAFLFMTQKTMQAQEIGVDICACQPAVYAFTLDFDLMCADLNVAGPGISDQACLVEARGIDTEDGADLRPIAVNSIQIFELDQNLQVSAQTPLAGNFLSGSTFTYTSVVATAPDMLTPETLPRGIQLVFTGTNASDQAIVNTFIILYTNDCGIYPVLQKGQVAGWTVFSNLGNPTQRFCPLSATPDPTVAPTMSMIPSSHPSQSPTISMIPTMSLVPTTPPLFLPTVQPSQMPSSIAPIPSTSPPQVPTTSPSSSPTTTSNYQMTSKGGKGKSKVRSDSQSMKQGKGSSSVSSKSKRSSSSRTSSKG